MQQISIDDGVGTPALLSNFAVFERQKAGEVRRLKVRRPGREGMLPSG